MQDFLDSLVDKVVQCFTIFNPILLGLMVYDLELAYPAYLPHSSMVLDDLHTRQGIVLLGPGKGLAGLTRQSNTRTSARTASQETSQPAHATFVRRTCAPRG